MAALRGHVAAAGSACSARHTCHAGRLAGGASTQPILRTAHLPHRRLHQRRRPSASTSGENTNSSSGGGSGSGGDAGRGAAPRSRLAFQPGTAFQPGDALGGGKYEVQRRLGAGTSGVTYEARGPGGTSVAVKVLSLRGLRDWKQLDLFEREAQTLRGLDHPGIPRYLDYFEEDSDLDRCFFLVQELAEGQTLAELVAGVWHAHEAEVSRIASELLKILQYLGSRRPPVSHRDVKPENIVIEGGKAGGRVFLVDFGGVQAAASAGDKLGSTIVGTYGYMAPEQFRGAASPASDLYGLGATLLYLLSGQPPSAFPVERMRLDFSQVSMGARLEAVLEGLLEPLPEERLGAEQALALLSGKRMPAAARPAAAGGSAWGLQQQRPPGAPVPDYELRKPAGSRIQVKKRGPRLEIDIPPSGFNSNSVTTGAFALVWNAFVAFWTVSALVGGGVLFALFSLPFWAAGAQLLKQTFGRQFIRERIEISLSSWKVEQQLALAGKGGQAQWREGGFQSKEFSGRAEDLSGAEIEVPAIVNGEPQYQLVLREGVNRYVLAEGLDPLEMEWLQGLINAHLQENRGRMQELGGYVGKGQPALEASSSATQGGRRFEDLLEGAPPGQQRTKVPAGRGAVDAAAAMGKRAAAAGRRAGKRAAAAGQAAVDDATRLAASAEADAWQLGAAAAAEARQQRAAAEADARQRQQQQQRQQAGDSAFPSGLGLGSNPWGLDPLDDIMQDDTWSDK